MGDAGGDALDFGVGPGDHGDSPGFYSDLPGSYSGTMPASTQDAMNRELGITDSPMADEVVGKMGEEPGFIEKNKWPLGLAALTLMSGSGGKPKQQPQPQSAQASGPSVTVSPMSRGRRSPSDYYTYGMTSRPDEAGGSFFTDNRAPSVVGAARGGHFIEGPGGGRDDSIPARLSDGEYVMDAETVAMLGDGSNDTGARKLDQLRERLRRHKGRNLSKGKISHDAGDPAKYLGGKV